MAVSSLLERAFGPGASLVHDPSGHPRVEPADAVGEGCISISHSRMEAVLAVREEGPVGIDVENFREALRSTVHKWDSRLSHSSPARELLAAWTAKEAIFKAMPSPQPAGLMEIPFPHPLYEVLFFETDGALTAVAIPQNDR